jgi:CBS domain-containing protein
MNDTVLLNATLEEVFFAFAKCRENFLCVVDDFGKIYGIIGKTEIFNAATEHTETVNKQIDFTLRQASDIMNRKFISASSPQECDEIFSKRNINAVPVILQNGILDNIYVNKNYKSKPEDEIRDYFRNIDINDDYKTEFECLICGNIVNPGDSKRYVSYDVFSGGVLVRYECSSCGAIVGPEKMLKLSDEELSADYKRHYDIYSEGDTTEHEIFTFMQFRPQKDKTYLNWGCGVWSKTLEILRERGYNVYGYEPYASGESPFILSSFDELKKYRFDGIFSNNLLEHLRYPVDDFIRMRSLLADDESEIIHTTACYEYLYEYSRFHLSFYTEDSINVLSERSGLTHSQFLRDNSMGIPYISCKFRRKKVS